MVLLATILFPVAMTSTLWAGEPPTLKVGDPAPKLHVSKWLNGDPVEKLEKGTTYVIECWATWCGPCRASIPHVSELNTKYKDKTESANPGIMDTLARAQFEKGDVEKAVATMKRAIGKMEDARPKAKLEATLKKYESSGK
jgi:thiol-disulfide isomerase/thioredoxin